VSVWSDAISAHSGVDLLAWYRMNEGSGTTLTDSGPNGLTGTIAATGITYGNAGGIANDTDKCLTFAGSSNAATAPDTSNYLDVLDNFSVGFWVKRSNTGTDWSLLNKGTNGIQCRFKGSDNKLAFIKSGGAGMATSSVAVTDTTDWHFVVFTKSGASQLVYLDGADVTVAGTTATLAGTNNVLRIGHLGNGTEQFPGSMDELFLLSAVLTPAQVLALWDAGKGYLRGSSDRRDDGTAYDAAAPYGASLWARLIETGLPLTA